MALNFKILNLANFIKTFLSFGHVEPYCLISGFLIKKKMSVVIVQCIIL